jgi:Fic family protein
MTKTPHDTALRDIKGLLEKNVLMQDTKGGKSTSYRLV